MAPHDAGFYPTYVRLRCQVGDQNKGVSRPAGRDQRLSDRLWTLRQHPLLEVRGKQGRPLRPSGTSPAAGAAQDTEPCLTIHSKRVPRRVQRRSESLWPRPQARNLFISRPSLLGRCRARRRGTSLLSPQLAGAIPRQRQRGGPMQIPRSDRIKEEHKHARNPALDKHRAS